MRLTLGRRVLMFFHWLVSLLTCIVLAAWIIAPDFVTGVGGRLFGHMTFTQQLVIGIVALVITLMLVVLQALIIFPRRQKRDERGFITVDAGDGGQVRIAVSAVEQMVRQAVTPIEGIQDMKIDIEGLDDGIGLALDVQMVAGSHVPTVTMNMQQAIRRFVESNCGVLVRNIVISISAVTELSPLERRKTRKAYAQVPPEPEPVEPKEAEASPAEEAPLPEIKPIELHFDHLSGESTQDETPEGPQED